MKIFAISVVLLATAFCALSNTSSLEKFSPPFSTNTSVLWTAPTNLLPKIFWVYKRLPPRPFSVSAISNAVMLAAVQDKGFPKPSTNAYFIWSDPNPCGTSYSIFSIQPAASTISFEAPDQNLSTNHVPDNETVRKRAFECAARFGLSLVDLVPKNVYSASNAAGCDQTLTNGICARGIFLSRQLDGVSFWGDANNGSDGFSIEFGSYGEIRSFYFVWPNLERGRKGIAAKPEEILKCIKKQRTLVLPEGEEKYFDRIRTLATARTFTITKITPYYGVGVFGEMPTNDTPPQFITPFAELEAIADFGNSNQIVRLLSPVLSSDATRLLTDTIK